ncbi:MAG: glutathione S-transferase family protein [Proteobacteria bacterium]|nr:glutathione S-transferase family protein [Pseudomonadota bacterium]
MKLYVVPAAPNPTKVMLYIAERDALGDALPVEQIVVNTLKGRHREPEHLARNPFGTLPVLELDDGRFLLESLSIIRFLETVQVETALVQGSAVEQALAFDLERTIELRFANFVGRYVHATNSPLGIPANPELAAELLGSMTQALDYLQSLLGDGRQWLGGEQISLADITLQSALQFARFAKVVVIEGYPSIEQWDARYRRRPAAQQVLRF